VVEDYINTLLIVWVFGSVGSQDAAHIRWHQANGPGIASNGLRYVHCTINCSIAVPNLRSAKPNLGFVRWHREEVFHEPSGIGRSNFHFVLGVQSVI